MVLSSYRTNNILRGKKTKERNILNYNCCSFSLTDCLRHFQAHFYFYFWIVMYVVNNVTIRNNNNNNKTNVEEKARH